MATTTPIAMPDLSYELLPPPISQLDDQTGHGGEEACPGQSRSSSLSDIGDRVEEDVVPSERGTAAMDSDQDDTEAETERLEDSPHQLRKSQNLVLATANSMYRVSQSPSAQYTPVESQARGKMRRGSDAALLKDSSVGADSMIPISRSPRKRKRSEDEILEATDQPTSKRPIPDNTISAKQPTSKSLMKYQTPILPDRGGNSREASDVEKQEFADAVPGSHVPLQSKSKQGKRKTRKAITKEASLRSPSASSVNGAHEPTESAEAVDSNGEDVEDDEPGEHAGLENTAKDEEVVVKRKSAMDSLTAIERCFASLRDKLYDERLAKCDAELAMLEGPDVTHPELLSMKEVLEQRRDEKIQYESTLLKYKLGSLQNKSVAEKAQVHGQYLQTVREIRDRNLEQVNQEWYQIHKERRSREDDVPEYMYLFPARRSQQITSQAAYNKEVSLLSGIAKYRGFPAAPEIRSARADEIDSDFEKLGIVQQPVAPIARHPPTLRASLSANAVLSRPRHVADEHFLEQNPWANPQHPAHLHRQASALSRTVSPLATPALQRRSTETTAGLKSASTVADAQKAVYSSTASTPATGSQEKGLKMTRLGLDAAAEHQAQTSTPSRLLPPDTDNAASMPKSQHSGLQKSHVSAMISSEKAHPSSAGRNQAQEIHMKPYVPKVPRRVDSPSSMPTPKLPSSPSARFPIMRADDMPRLPGRSPTPQHYHRPVPVNITANGGSDR